MPLEIQQVSTTLYNHYRLRDLGTSIASILDKHHTDHVSLSPISKELSQHADDLGLAQNKELGSELTDEINTVETERDDLLKGFFSGVEFNLRHFNTERRASAVRIYDEMRRQDSRIHDEPDAVETSMINTLVTDMQKENNAADLQVLELTGFIPALIEANSRFVTLVNRRAELESGKKQPLIKPTRKKLHQSLRAMTEYLTLMNRFNNGALDSTVKEINEHISQHTALAKADQTRKESDSE